MDRLDLRWLDRSGAARRGRTPYRRNPGWWAWLACAALVVVACGLFSPPDTLSPTMPPPPLASHLPPAKASAAPPSEAPPTQAPPKQASTEPAPTLPAEIPGAGIGLPPAGQLYHGVFPGGVTGEEDDLTPEELRAYEQAAGKPAAWVYFSHNWYRDRRFPLETAQWIREAGSVPFIRLMLRNPPDQEDEAPLFSLQAILDGEFDEDLRAWAAAARDFGTPLIVEFGTEVNGEWFPWNGAWNGGGELQGYGDPDEPDGPERFRDAYRHIISLARDEGADNITWVFHANDGDVPDEDWNRFENYYPGDEWIDWIGVSSYGVLTPFADEWRVFRDEMDAVYPRLAALSPEKPVVLLEFGTAGGNPLGDQAEWADAALADLTGGRWPRIVGFSWWNEFWRNDDRPENDTTMRLQDNPALAAVFRKWVGENEAVLGRAILLPR
jgi:hypothetical protein